MRKESRSHWRRKASISRRIQSICSPRPTVGHDIIRSAFGEDQSGPSFVDDGLKFSRDRRGLKFEAIEKIKERAPSRQVFDLEARVHHRVDFCDLAPLFLSEGGQKFESPFPGE